MDGPQEENEINRSILACLACITDYGRIIAISQIIYWQYHIWDIFVFGLNNKVFFVDKLRYGNQEQGTHSEKMCADSLAKNTLNTQRFIWPICPIGSKVWDIVEKRLHRASVVRGLYVC